MNNAMFKEVPKRVHSGIRTSDKREDSKDRLVSDQLSCLRSSTVVGPVVGTLVHDQIANSLLGWGMMMI